VNLPVKTIRGHRSEGMLFDIGFADGLRPAFAVPEWPVPDGVRAG
jgi:tRNA-binding protein